MSKSQEFPPSYFLWLDNFSSHVKELRIKAAPVGFLVNIKLGVLEGNLRDFTSQWSLWYLYSK